MVWRFHDHLNFIAALFALPYNGAQRMSLQIGQQVGSYEITSLIGKGGMGEVYRARDLKLKREVAIKALPDEFSRDADRIARFQREAEVLASLNHPHVAAIYDLVESGSTRFLVLELVEGNTLADRIARGPIPVEETLEIAKQIAEALEAAHERGVIHRDLKPANIKLAGNGTVKVLDFGLAKVRETAGADVAASNSPTMITGVTQGMILGTAAYMSPEQAKGKEADRTSDIWAFGCVLYEMLTGRTVFQGETANEILAGVLTAEPDWHWLPMDTPEGIRRLLRRCLLKSQKKRLPHIGAARIEINEVQGGPQVDGPVVQSAAQSRERIAWISIVALVTLFGVAVIVWALRPAPLSPELRLEINTPPTTDPVSMAISADGQKIVFLGISGSQSGLWLRSMDSVSLRPLAGTDGASFPFWSPDNRSVGFFAGGKLKRIDIDNGSVQVLANAAAGRGGTWNRDGTILFATYPSNSIFRISATGGEPEGLMQEATQQGLRRFPQFLPDGRHFLYYVIGSPEARGVYVGEIDRPETQRVVDADSPAAYTSGQLLFVRGGTLFAQDFDPVRLTLGGNPLQVAHHITVDPVMVLAALSASAAGPIIYRTGLPSGQRQLAWFDRSGKEIGKVGDPDSAGSVNPAVSSDGQRLARNRTVDGNNDIWLLDLGRGVLSRFTFHAAADLFPVWSPNGNRIVFDSDRTGTFDLYEKSVNGGASEQRLLATPKDKQAMDWSPDGHFLVYRSLDPKTSYDLWVLPLDGDRKPFPFVQTDFDERDGQFSPDGMWIAYQSNESGRFEIYVQSFPGGGKWQISTNGGAQARWRRDGKELFYIALDARLMAVPVRLASDRKVVDASSPTPLFDTRVGGALQGNLRQQYVVSADGQRFLMNTVTQDPSITSPITVILNWRPPSK